MDNMDMSSMSTSMTMPMSSTSSAAMSTGTSMGGMDMGGMGGMDGMDMGGCSVSMLWNWNTIDACFLSSSWHITSRGMFAGSCIGVICLVICLEFLRRVGREYDAFIVRRARLRHQYLSVPKTKITANPKSNNATTSENNAGAEGDAAACCSTPADAAKSSPPPSPTPAANANYVNEPIDIRPTLIEQLIRAVLHMLQFAVAYFVMLLAMYFNGYIIICIFIGAFLGSFIFSWERIGGASRENDATAVTKCCG